MSSTASDRELATPGRTTRKGGAGQAWFPLLLLLLALSDLRTELLLLLDHLTLTSLLTAIGSHPLAVVVLLAQPSLWRRYGRPRS